MSYGVPSEAFRDTVDDWYANGPEGSSLLYLSAGNDNDTLQEMLPFSVPDLLRISGPQRWVAVFFVDRPADPEYVVINEDEVDPGIRSWTVASSAIEAHPDRGYYTLPGPTEKDLVLLAYPGQKIEMGIGRTSISSSNYQLTERAPNYSGEDPAFSVWLDSLHANSRRAE